ncbi:MAG: Ni/Fe-hydrogenase cytochrome b subunit, partial [Bryobacteraceae bacterium]
VFSFIANRLNVAITGMEAGSGTHYNPKWSEVAVTLSLVAAGFAVFRVIGQYFPVFEAHSLEPAMEDGMELEVDPLAVG